MSVSLITRQNERFPSLAISTVFVGHFPVPLRSKVFSLPSCFLSLGSSSPSSNCLLVYSLTGALQRCWEGLLDDLLVGWSVGRSSDRSGLAKVIIEEVFVHFGYNNYILHFFN